MCTRISASWAGLREVWERDMAADVLSLVLRTLATPLSVNSPSAQGTPSFDNWYGRNASACHLTCSQGMFQYQRQTVSIPNLVAIGNIT